MQHKGYLHWAIGNTKTTWWHDSAEPGELVRGLERGARGVTTNPVLSHLALSKNKRLWTEEIRHILSKDLGPEGRAEALMRVPITRAAEKLMPEYERSGGAMGFVCAQVNPVRAADRKGMLSMARRLHKWAPNIAVKLPVTAAGLDVLEKCTAEGITITATVSFTVPQVIATAERYRQGIQRARRNGVEPGKCFAVIMVGRLDDYLRDVAQDYQADVDESDVQQAGLAVTKRAYSIYAQRGYEAVLIVAALRGAYHMTELAGAKLIVSIAPKYQEILLSQNLPCEERIHVDVSPEAIERLSNLPEFVRAYDPEGMTPQDFIAYGVTQKTLAQFYEVGWRHLETFELDDRRQ